MSLEVDSGLLENALEGLWQPTAVQQELLVRYSALLDRWSKAQRLVGWRSADRFALEGLADAWSQSALVVATPEGPLIDLGSGAGLPGIVFAIADPNRPVHLVESRRKRASFLRAVVRELKLPQVKVHQARSEGLVERVDAPPVTIISSRAMSAPMDVLVEADRWGVSVCILSLSGGPLPDLPGWVIEKQIPGRPATSRRHLIVHRKEQR